MRERRAVLRSWAVPRWLPGWLWTALHKAGLTIGRELPPIDVADMRLRRS